MFALILVLVFAGLYFGFLGFLGDFVGDLDVQMNPAFYFTVFGLFTVIYAHRVRASRASSTGSSATTRCSTAPASSGRSSATAPRTSAGSRRSPTSLERILLGSGRMVLTTPQRAVTPS